MVIGISFLVVVFSYRHSGRESHPTRSLTANFLACLQLPSQRPREIIIEDLSHLQGKARSKKISRLCSSWARNENQERITVHAYVGGSGIKTVNAAYSSQTCPDPGCGYVHRDNRHGDMFHCRNPYWECNWQGYVDHVAAMNLKLRIEDHEINRFTPYREVKKILEERFLRRLESRNIQLDTKASAQRLRPQANHSC
ncbi:zinc ribbon domain-containing protein [Ferrimicrobium acidiphilum]|uniref:zinc ribbon domain-containing protein n=1 Tax=Ferrimicrobium acidiphilum TaxID=121039 RepID=UPI003C6D5F0D